MGLFGEAKPKRIVAKQYGRDSFLGLANPIAAFFLLGGQAAATACRPSASAYLKAAYALLFIEFHDHANGSVTQANFLRDLMPVHSAFIGTNHLPPTLMLRSRTQLASIVLSHIDGMQLHA